MKQSLEPAGILNCFYLTNEAVFQNVRSVRTASLTRNELWNLKHTAELGNADIYSFVETWLDEKILDTELEIEGYQIFRRDRGS